MCIYCEKQLSQLIALVCSEGSRLPRLLSCSLSSQRLITGSSQEKPPDVKSEPLVYRGGYSHVQI